jgi:hypothetical protein
MSSPLQFLVHEAISVGCLGFVLIVSATAQPQVLDGRCAAAGYGINVIELQELAGPAPMACVANERALGSIAFSDGALDLGRDVT